MPFIPGSQSECLRLSHACLEKLRQDETWAHVRQLSQKPTAPACMYKVSKYKHCRKRKADHKFSARWLLKEGLGMEGRMLGGSCGISSIGLPHGPAANSIPGMTWGQWDLQPKQLRCLPHSRGTAAPAGGGRGHAWLGAAG